MIEKRESKPSERRVTLEERTEPVVRVILGDSAAQEAHVNSVIAEAISAALADERRNCARILDAIKDEFIDWCALNRISSPEELRVAKMLRKAAALIRAQTR